MSYLIFLLLTNYFVTARVFNATFNLGQSGISFDTIDTTYNPITAPSTGDTVTVGTTYPLKWTRTTTEFIEFKLFAVQNESYYIWVDLEFNVPADSPGSYEWSVAKTIPSGQNYVLTSNLEGMSQIFNVANPDMPAVSSQISSSASSSSASSSSASSSSASSSSTTTATRLSASSSSTTTTAGVSGGTPGTTTTKGATETSGASSSGSGLVETGSSTAGPNAGGNNRLSAEAKIGLGVGITFGVIATITGIVTFWYMPKRSRKTTKSKTGG